VEVRKWRKCEVTYGKMKLMKWTPVSDGKRRTVPRNQLNRKKKKIFERLQRNTNQPLTRSLRSQLSMTRDSSGYAVHFNDRKMNNTSSRPQSDSSGLMEPPPAFPDSHTSSAVHRMLQPAVQSKPTMTLFTEDYLQHTSL